MEYCPVRTGRGLRLVAASLILFTLLLVGSVRTATAAAPISLLISNLRDTSFTISWLTALPERGQVQLIGGSTFDDVRGPMYSGSTHYVTVAGLSATSDYQFQVISGDAAYDNGGAPWSVKTGVTLAPAVPDGIVGRVKNANGKDAPDAIVVLTIQHEQVVSAPLSALVTPADSGFFHLNLSDLRSLDVPAPYFEYTRGGDLVTIQAVNAGGMGVVKLDTGDPRLRTSDPAQVLVLAIGGQDQAPALVVRAPTPTPVPPAPPEDPSGVVLGVGTTALAAIGIFIIAILFVWRR